jgi:hypothetical protein
MRAITKFATAAAAAFSLAAVAVPADAAVFIGLQQAGVDGDGAGLACVSGGICTVASGASFAAFPNLAFPGPGYGSFEIELVTGANGVLPTLLTSTTNDHNLSGAGGTIDIYITRTGITDPFQSIFRSSFTSNVIPAGWSVAQATYFGTANQLYGGTQLASHTFTSIGTSIVDTPFSVTAPYSLTERYTLTTAGGAAPLGSSLNTISVHAVIPEPTTWALMILGFGSAGAMLRSRRRAVAAVA